MMPFAFENINRSTLSVFAVCACLMMASCQKDPVALAGDLEVAVIGSLGNPVVGAELLLEGISSEGFPSESRLSDDSGKALFEQLPVGAYQVGVTVQGKTITLPVSVAGDSIHPVSIRVDDLPGRSPGLYLSEYPNPVNVADSIYFSAVVDDDRTPAAGILVTWSHIIDNVPEEIFSDYAAAFNEVSFFYGGLRLGENVFQVEAKDGDGRTTVLYLSVFAE